jgi:hypothetical protein
MPSTDEPDIVNEFNSNRRPTVLLTPSSPSPSPKDRSSSPRFFSFGRKRLKFFFDYS